MLGLLTAPEHQGHHSCFMRQLEGYSDAHGDLIAGLGVDGAS